jgi:hypothetical protein
MTAKTPHQPRKPPRSHHKNTTPKHPFFAKTPTKTPLHHKIKKISSKKENGGPANRRTAHFFLNPTYTVA